VRVTCLSVVCVSGDILVVIVVIERRRVRPAALPQAQHGTCLEKGIIIIVIISVTVITIIINSVTIIIIITITITIIIIITTIIIIASTSSPPARRLLIRSIAPVTSQVCCAFVIGSGWARSATPGRRCSGTAGCPPSRMSPA
jgi:hypothetical protein